MKIKDKYKYGRIWVCFQLLNKDLNYEMLTRLWTVDSNYC
jgi:hypothetical protein